MSEAETQPVADPLPPTKVKCEQCNDHDAKYKCPKCFYRTCSLACSKQHKASSGCSGERDKAKFVKRAEYDANTLMSDYGFLQDLARDHANLAHDAEEKGVKAKGKQPSSGGGGPSGMAVLNRAQKNIVARAKSERQVHIRYMSPGIQRHKINRTIWATSKARLVWTVEIAVPELTEGLNKWVESGFHDVCKLGDLWSRLLLSGRSPRPADGSVEEGPRKRARTDSTRIQLTSDDGADHPFSSAIPSELLQRLKVEYGQILPEDLVWLIRVQDTPANKPTFCKINPCEPLYTQLRYQTVLEFPTIYVYKQAPEEIAGHVVAIVEPHVPVIEQVSASANEELEEPLAADEELEEPAAADDVCESETAEETTEETTEETIEPPPSAD
ncbi:Box C/D snoRNA accumulation [Coemansia aciculifera]|uniref:Box C/D snoRNA accumulation n=1 Tax=Coemansia aciculifera TaxID=417176 RepID=A0ACC1M624_9FUNG|nr:Box C/D snoRNA accumulation [Coemansia aciculifera]